MARPYLDSPVVSIKTLYGPATLTLTGAKMVYFNASTHAATDPTKGQTVNSVRYAVNAHVEFVGEWRLRRSPGDQHGGTEYQSLYASRAEMNHTSRDQASDSARGKLKKAILDAVAEFALSRPGDMKSAEMVRLNNAARNAEENLEKLRADVEGQEAVLRDLEGELAEVAKLVV